MPELLKFIPNYISSSGVNVSMTLVEPKASGKSIKQMIYNETKLNISEIKSNFVNQGKIENARVVAPYIESGRCILVKGSWNDAFLQQVATFPNAKHDEHIDLTCYGIERNLMLEQFFTF
jgi:predicted phage terminase large subunit-like protein